MEANVMSCNENRQCRYCKLWKNTSAMTNPTTSHIFTCHLHSNSLLHLCTLCHQRGSLDSVAITTRRPIGWWNLTLLSNLSLCLLTIIDLALPSGSRLYVLVRWTWHSCHFQALTWHLTPPKSLIFTKTWSEKRGIPRLVAVFHSHFSPV